MSLTLLSPWLLLAGLGIVVPILIHLLQRRREVVLPYSMVRFILLARKRSSRRLKLKRIFLLLLRAAAVMLLAVILARPVLLTADASLTTGSRGRTVIIVDNSLSMAAAPEGRAERFGILREILSEYVGQSAPGARFAVMPAAAGDEDPAPAWLSIEEVAGAVGGITVLADKGDFNRSFTEAHRLLREARGDEERIAVFTDLAQGSWSDFSYSLVSEADLGVPVEIFRIGPPVESAGVTSISIEGEHRVSGGDLMVKAEIVNERAAEDLAVDLLVDERHVDRQIISVPRGGIGSVVFAPGDLEPGSSVIRVRLEDDDYGADDSRSAGLSMTPTVRVLLVDGDPGRSLIESETFFLSEALNAAVPFGDEPIEAVIASREEAGRIGIEDFNVLVLANVAPRGEIDAASFLARGGGVVVFWGDRCRVEDYTLYLPSLLPGQVTGVEEAETGGAFRIDSIDSEIDVFAPFLSPGAGTFSTAAFRKRLSMTATPGTGVPAAFGDGSPWIVTGRVGEGTVVFVTSTADIAWNDLPTKPVFLPFVRRLVLSLAGRLGGTAGEEVTAGEEMVFAGRPEDAFKTISVNDPDGGTTRIDFLPDEKMTRAVFGGTNIVGQYRYRGEGVEGVFVVNPPAAESFGRPLNDEEIESRFQKVQLEVADVDGREIRPGYSQKGAISMTRPLFAALICILVVEMIVAGPRRGILPFRKKAQ